MIALLWPLGWLGALLLVGGLIAVLPSRVCQWILTQVLR